MKSTDLRYMRTGQLLLVVLLASSVVGITYATSDSPAQVVTSYSFATIPVSTITWTSTTQQNLVSDSFALSAPGPSYGCEYQIEDFNASAGSVVGTLTSDHTVDFYFLTRAVFDQWRTHGTCDGPDSYLDVRTETTNYTFNVTVPTSGEYILLFINQWKSYTCNITITANSGATTVTYTTTSDSFSEQTFYSTESMSESYSSEGMSTSLPQIGSLGASGFGGSC